ncbi:unnamed protein product [Rotaria sp. Silwood1]|nr:unnamed protein product [Rotaria sp. Silwood1]CAF0860998.1 unnamed protein product [Rotaria sp. Silwood1]CAF3379602.1 unnamed protein product [Rotaria sp. Silwood1]CAF3385567.1 unnamed protein product [Rotaria sp. Silwood1]CAF4535998.1 unnamed protein product [Rotaria sp. Silwood1]
MQSDSNKQDYTQKDNNYNFEGVYPSYQGSIPPYLPYPQQSVNGTSYEASSKSNVGRTPLHQQQGINVTRVHQRFRNNNLLTPITTFSLQLAIVVNFYSTYYNGFWAGIFLVFGGSIMVIIGFRPSFPLLGLMRLYIFTLVFSTMGLTFSIVDYSLSARCTSISSLYCDDSLASNLKVILLVTFTVALIHTGINMIVISKEQKTILIQSNPRNLSN